MDKKIAGLAGLAAATLLAAAPAHADGTVKIGLIMTYSGQFADLATMMDNAIKLYMKQHGDTVAGKKIELIRKDSGTGGTAPDVAKRLAQELVVRDKADIIAGFSLTPEALAAADVGTEAEEADGDHQCGDRDHHDAIALFRAHVDCAAAADRNAGRLGGQERDQTGLHHGVGLWAGHRFRSVRSRMRSSKAAARSSGRCAFQSPIRIFPRLRSA